MSDTSNAPKNEYQKLTFAEFLKISWWSVTSIIKAFPITSMIHIVTITILQFSDIANSFIMALIIDRLIQIIQSGDLQISQMYPQLYIIIGYKLAETLITSINGLSMTRIRLYYRSELRRSFYTKLKDLGIQTLEQPGMNDTINRADRYLGEVLSFYRQIIDIFSLFVKLISLSFIMIKFLPQLVIIMFIVYLPYLIFDKFMRSKVYKFDYETTEQGRIVGHIANDLSTPYTLKEITTTGAFNFLDQKYKNFFDWSNKIRKKLLYRWRIGGQTFGFLNTIILVFFGFVQLFEMAIKQIISIGDVTFWIRTIGSFSNTIDQVLVYGNDLFEYALWFKEAHKIYNSKPAFKDGDVKLPALESGPSIKIEDLSFNYPNNDRLVLKNINLNINSNEKIAIVGHNGAGKTTLIKLITRFYQPTQGKILINNTNLQDINIESFYQNLGVLFQDYNTYEFLTAKENIHIGRSNKAMDDTNIRNACISADALEFIEDYPNKFDQILSERIKGGVRPSTGQWQKIAIARFFYRNSPLVIFDEPTAAIDPVSEFNIFNQVYEFFKNKTVIIISHKFSTVRNADRIIVMDKGGIVEDGTHEQLMEKDGFYAKAFKLQAQGYK